MAVPTNPSHSTASRTRWGGILIGLAALFYMASFSSFFLGVPPPGPNDTVEERADHWVDGRNGLIVAGWFGVFADALLATGAFFLVMRPYTGRTGLPVPSFWIMAGISAIVFLGLDGLMAGGLYKVAEGFRATPQTVGRPIFETVESSLNILMGMALLMYSVALGVVFWGESVSSDAAMPRWACWVALVGCLAGVVGSVGFLTGLVVLGFALGGLYRAFLGQLFLGVRVGFAKLDRLAATRPGRA